MADYCKNKNPPCPSDCVHYKRKDSVSRCRNRPHATARSKAESKGEVYVAKSKQPARTRVSEREEEEVPRFKQFQEEYARQNVGKKRANYTSVLEGNNSGEAMRGLFNDISTLRKVDRKAKSSFGEYVDECVDEALESHGLTREQIDEHLQNPIVETYINIREKLSRNEMIELYNEVLRISSLLEPHLVDKKVPKEKVKLVDKVFIDSNICKYIKLEEGKLFGEVAKKSDESRRDEIKEIVRKLQLSYLSVSKGEMCFAIAQRILLSEKDFVDIYLKETKKIKAFRATKSE